MGLKISVIIPTYYRNDLVCEAIESVLQQDYDPIELIVVDDSGTGHAKTVLDKYDQVKAIIGKENRGWGGAYTTGIKASTGEYIQLLDDDDYLLEGKLSKTAELLDNDPEIGVAYCGLDMDVREPRFPDPEVSGDVLERALRFKMFPCCTITMLIEREVLLDTLPLATYGDDLDLMIELAQRTKFDYVDECLAFYRRETSSKWVSLKKFEETKRIIRHQSDIYDQYPGIRRAVLAELYEKEGQARIRKYRWSLNAFLCFLKATYYSDDNKLRCGGQAVASLFGRFGWDTARRLRNHISLNTRTDNRS
ncbi:Glycosyl transferase family 2 [Halalkaliarchaeum sp. AArc-CO]|uniref:glycosyltransferase family 2 protein n=1 Tax=Halalkaliarchaeum sp. AArc-CO TaxID=2866381 RepID=UPI00217E2D09|nr:glycosyltransferase family 2 protein [Halalkaliarchaeum sp. AArc-CO]UWG50002.1 Glycosyl transferase family 2 [Halalkaliarchaeum sp. AArc-CO]